MRREVSVPAIVRVPLAYDAVSVPLVAIQRDPSIVALREPDSGPAGLLGATGLFDPHADVKSRITSPSEPTPRECPRVWSIMIPVGAILRSACKWVNGLPRQVA